MKKNLSLLSLKMLAVAIVFTIFQSFSPTTEVTPADGCKYTGDSTTFCVWGQYAVTNCANTTSTTTCGVNLPPSEE